MWRNRERERRVKPIRRVVPYRNICQLCRVIVTQGDFKDLQPVLISSAACIKQRVAPRGPDRSRCPLIGFGNDLYKARAVAIYHVDRLRLKEIPKGYTMEPRKDEFVAIGRPPRGSDP